MRDEKIWIKNNAVCSPNPFNNPLNVVCKYIKGQMIAIVGRLQVRSWEDEQKKKHWTTEVVTEEQDFTAKAAGNNNPDGFQKVSDTVMPDSDLPF